MSTITTPVAETVISDEPDCGVTNGDNWRDCLTGFAEFCRAHVNQLVVLTLAYVLLLAVVGNSNVPYWEDSYRRLWGGTNWGVWDARWGSDLVARMLNTGSSIVDLGLLSFAISGLALGAAAAIVVYALAGERANWLTFLWGLAFGLNPWTLNAFAFRFDGPFIAIGVLLATATVLFYRANRITQIVAYALLTFATLNFYQNALGLIISLFLTMLLLDWLRGNVGDNQALRRFGWGILAIVVGAALHGLQLVFMGGTGRDSMFDLSNLVQAFGRNLATFIHAFLRDNTVNWLIVLALAFVVALVVLLQQSVRAWWQSLIAILIYLILGVLASGGVLLFADGYFLAVWARHRFPLAMGVALIMIIASVDFRLPTVFRVITRAALIALAYIWLSVVFLFGQAQREQQTALEFQAAIIFSDVNAVYQPGDLIVYDPGVFTNSTYMDRLVERFPIFDGTHPYVTMIDTHSDNALFRLSELLGMHPFVELTPMQQNPGVCDLRGQVERSGRRWEVWRVAEENTVCAIFPKLAQNVVNTHYEQELLLPLARFPFAQVGRPNVTDIEGSQIEMAIWSLTNPDDIQRMHPVSIVDGNARFVAPNPAGGWHGDKLVAHFFQGDRFLFQQIWEMGN